MNRLADIQAFASTLPRKTIFGEDRTPYLTRYLLQKNEAARVYLHNIHRHDLDDAPHNHPSEWTQTTILHGGYVERRYRPVGKRLVERPLGAIAGVRLDSGQSRIMGPDDYHRIARVDPNTWTLFMFGKPTADWGLFVNGRGLVPWRERLAERGIDVIENPAEWLPPKPMLGGGELVGPWSLADAAPDTEMRPCESCVAGGDDDADKPQPCKFYDETGMPHPAWLCEVCYRDWRAQP